MAFELLCATMIALLFGMAVTFGGYRLFITLLPIWGFLFGFGLGAQTLQALFGYGFLSTATSWIVGFIVGALFSVLSYMFFIFAVALLASSVGYGLGVGIMLWIGFNYGLITWMVGLVAGLVLVFITLGFNLQKLMIIIETAIIGGGILIGTMMLGPFTSWQSPPAQFATWTAPTASFLDKEVFYPGSKFRMGEPVLEQYIRQLIESHQTNSVNIAWQGGEPTLMGLDFYRRTLEVVEKYRRPGMTFLHTMQTNGTLLDDEWAAFFAEHNFLLGISIDGPRPLHDIYRVDKGGKPTFDKVMRGLRLLQKHGVDYNVLTTVNRVNGDYPLEVYRFLRDEVGTTWMQFIPVVERINADGLTLYQEGTAVSDRSVQPEQFGRFLSAIFDEWVRHDVGTIYVQTFEAALSNWLGLPNSGMCVFNATCGTGLAIEHNGDLYSCDHFVEPNYLLGNIQDTHMIELVASPQQIKFGQDKRDTLPRYCQECDVRFACHGECPKNRFVPDAGWRAGPQLPVRRLQGVLLTTSIFP
jgi:uncharacterized protein